MPVPKTDLRPRFVSARDQGSRPTCLAFALSDTHAAVRGSAVPYSSDYLFYHAVQHMPQRDPHEGLAVNAALKALRIQGQPLESDWPYVDPLPADVSAWCPPGSASCRCADGKDHLALLVEIKRSLDNGRPVVLGLNLTERFYRPHQDGRLPEMDADQLDYGAHAVVAVGYGNDAGDEFLLIRNSWGDGWGDAGHAWLPFSYVSSQLIVAAVLEPSP